MRINVWSSALCSSDFFFFFFYPTLLTTQHLLDTRYYNQTIVNNRKALQTVLCTTRQQATSTQALQSSEAQTRLHEPASSEGSLHRTLAPTLILIIKVVIGAGHLLFSVLDGFKFVNTRTVVCGVSPERDVETLQEAVHACQERLRRVRGCLTGRLTRIYDHAIREVRGHNEVVLHDECRLLDVHDVALDDLGSDDTLL
eukprot:TRINITY_DN36314_c1_g1_i2.p1 TRINITY_DN36314_c1_g1~~TRINITY_DN36314_c1_g1_i2.p1  ORF type:complete len:206 (-),score=-1.42 TRINITY_DN36314_c1_g1_i2:11-607(-)